LGIYEKTVFENKEKGTEPRMNIYIKRNCTVKIRLIYFYGGHFGDLLSKELFY